MRRRVGRLALAIGAPALLGGCLAGSPSRPPADTRSAGAQEPAPSASALARAIHDAVNGHRARQGLPALRWDEQAAAAAREHSQAMASGRVPFGHDGFDGRAAAIGGALEVGALAENVAYDGGAARGMGERVVDGWLRSGGHRRNIEGDFNATGLGVAAAADGRHYFTQIFVQVR